MAIENRRARFEYDLLETFTAGMVLEGWEVKSLRAGSANLRSAWVTVRDGEVWLENCSISPWKFSAQTAQDERRSRKLLLHAREISRLSQKANNSGHTIIPLKIFDQKGHLKCSIALARGRKKYEKRQVLKERSEKKVARKALKDFNG
ncbi:MAG: SsrA-binding protein SmpB [Candidatus Gracilibacteria bacterium]|nr:SsrA-binding protein SmpB [Candidatus Gracilibacteria bacterium]